MEAQKKRPSLIVSLARLYISAAVQPAAIAANFGVRRDAHGGAGNRSFPAPQGGHAGGIPPTMRVTRTKLEAQRAGQADVVAGVVVIAFGAFAGEFQAQAAVAPFAQGVGEVYSHSLAAAGFGPGGLQGEG